MSVSVKWVSNGLAEAWLMAEVLLEDGAREDRITGEPFAYLQRKSLELEKEGKGLAATHYATIYAGMIR